MSRIGGFMGKVCGEYGAISCKSGMAAIERSQELDS